MPRYKITEDRSFRKDRFMIVEVKTGIVVFEFPPIDYGKALKRLAVLNAQ